jgi:hypothetical protein
MLLAMVSLGSGCVALPPARVSLGTGALAVQGRPTEAPLDTRIAVHPLQLDESALGRRFDFGVGYMRVASSSARIDAGFAEAHVVLWSRLGDNPLAPKASRAALGYLRLSLLGQVRVLGERDLPRLGKGLAAAVVFEAGSFVRELEGPPEHRGFFGRMLGETSTGFYLEGSDARLGDTSIWSLSTGLVLRTPGLFVVPFLDRS